jgi:hypothetical protein
VDNLKTYIFLGCVLWRINIMFMYCNGVCWEWWSKLVNRV